MTSGNQERSVYEQGLAQLKSLSPEGYSLALHLRFASARILMQTYRSDWIEYYTERGYLVCDPIVSWGMSKTGTERWSTLNHPDPHDILGQAAVYGLRFGVAVSHGSSSSRSIGGFARADREFTDDEIATIQKVVSDLHQVATPSTSLTLAQQMALRMVAAGHRTSSAAAMLGISESAFKARLKTARERLFARTTAEAIRRAQEHGLL
ncbi:autoinducer binding domain-containing protein [Yoonia sp. SS1-5]|uniref:Autoinducer binding domain-containing protein n=1 Tax=Yoonia rhodophyticola TaxID=3137370 RepID=A0AAN0M663_9RHOB